MDWNTLLAAAARHVLTTAAGGLAMHGYIMSTDQEKFVGAAMFLLGIGWSWWQKYGQSVVQAELEKFKQKPGTKQS